MSKRTIIRIGGLLLCVLFFTLPLVQCSQDSSINATGYELGNTHSDYYDKDYEPIWALFIIPFTLLACAFSDEIHFSALRNISIAGLAAQIIFMIIASNKLKESEGAFVLTPFNWLVIAIYAGMIGFIQYCIKQGTEG